MHKGLKEPIAKFYYDNYISIKDRTKFDTYNFRSLILDNNNLGQFLDGKLDIEYIPSTRKDNELDIDAHFKLEDITVPASFEGSTALLNKSFYMRASDFMHNSQYRVLFYFKKTLYNNKYHYGKFFYYVSPRQWLRIKQEVIDYMQNIPDIKYKDVNTSLMKDIVQYIGKNSYRVINSEKNYRIYFKLLGSTRKTRDESIYNSIIINIWFPQGSLPEYNI